ncbi:hypothetical protein [uncultured Bacteroides sp.]|uniref:hypothetical protein n=1 Tax=uncultured Bacteroides sp. TaxID=162156 RepID=UPI0025F0A2BE|nr:hypothetical protein [uncultured Bacteroides sp.]
MKLFKLLLIGLLFSCNNTENPETGETKQINVTMTNPDATDVINVAGIYNLEKNKEYCVREDGKYKILLTKSNYTDKNGKEQETLTYSILDVEKKEFLYYTTEINVAQRLEADWDYYDTNNPEEVDTTKPICSSKIKAE